MSQTSDSSGNPLRCVLLQASGNIKILTVPFHCALRYGKRARGFLRHNLIFTTEAIQVRFVLCEGEYLSFLNFDKCSRFFSKKIQEKI